MKLIIDYPDETERQRLETLVDDAKLLDKLYIPTRYPNGLPDLTPSEVYTEDDGQRAIVAAQRIVDLVRAVVG